MDANAEYKKWNEQPLEDNELREELNSIKDNEKEIYERFYKDLAFGTAGLRGILGVGTNRMNIYTIRRATQGLADYLLQNYSNPQVAIAHDSRINSDLFATETACVFAANGIHVYFFEELAPTPTLSFMVRRLKCQSGVVITASHNPSKYNGYKAYDSTGSQIGPETASEVEKNIAKIDIFKGVKRIDFNKAIQDKTIEYISQDLIDEYIQRVVGLRIRPEICKDSGLKIVYTPLNGAGKKYVLKALNISGFEDITIVKEQENPDGNFPTCPYPNPEILEAMQLGINLVKETNADLLLATDPDSDRCGTAVLENGNPRLISGNEMGVLLLDYLAKARTEDKTMPHKPVAVKSLVSTSLADKIAEHYHIEMRNVLTGFKFIGEQIAGLEAKGEGNRFLFGFEESYGYLSGDFVRDKDAVIASTLICEMAAWYKKQGMTLGNAIDRIYEKYGYSLDKVESYVFEGSDGMKKMADIMQKLRETPTREIAGLEVEAIEDYQQQVITSKDGKKTPTGLPSSNVLKYRLGEKGSFVARPSGTEPKLKLYYSVQGKNKEETMEIMANIKAQMEPIIKNV